MFVAVLICLALLPTRTTASTLTYVNRSSESGQQLTLRRHGTRIVLTDDRSQLVIASALAAETQRVVVRGASGGHDDTLTVDLSQPFSLAGGIDYDGGSDGWDTLVLTGGSVRTQTITQLTPHDGVIDLDGLMLRYSNLEPITDTAAAASLTVVGTAGDDTVTISDGPGAGQATISSPSFESVTFSNKTSVVFDGFGGEDSFTFNNPTRPTGLTSFIVENVATAGQTAAFDYPSLGISATGDVDLNDFTSAVDNIEIMTEIGDVSYRDVDAITVGGVSATLTGLHVEELGDVSLEASGIITLADTDTNSVISTGTHHGEVFVQAVGIGSDIVVTVNNSAILAPGGSITLVSDGSILLGTNGVGFGNHVVASEALDITALFDIVIAGATQVASDTFLANTGEDATVTAGEDFILSDMNGPGAQFRAGGLAGADAIINAVSVDITANGTTAVFSDSGDVHITTDRFILDAGSGIDAAEGSVDLISDSVPVDLGSTTDVAAALEISDAEVDRITTPILRVQSGTGFDLTVTQPITFANQLSLLSANTISATGTGSLSAPALRFDILSGGRTWTIDGTGITISPGAAIPYSGVTTLIAMGGNTEDTFDVTPAAGMQFNLNGNLPLPPSLPGDTLNVDISGSGTASLDYIPNPTGYSGTYNFGNGASVEFSGIETLDAETDLAITKTDGATSETPSTVVTYTITASNLGPLGITNVSVVDNFPPELTNVSWTCTASAGASCGSPAGGPVLDELITLGVGSTVTFEVTATISPTATGSLVNTATIAPPDGTTDPSSANNSSTDTDALIAANVPAIPTLTEGLLMLLAALLGLSAVVMVRRM